VDIRLASPYKFAYGAVSSGQGFTVSPAVNSGYIFLMLGIDVFPTVQPNNGSFSVYLQPPGPGVAEIPVWGLQQSANFPGPFAWRGIYPIEAGDGSFNVEADVPMGFSVWGLYLPDYLQDSSMRF
jgi:hypothetical protein